MGSRDRIVRIGLAIIIATLYFTHVITGTIALVFLIIVGILIINSFVGFCPLYYPFEISTNRKSN